MLAEHPDIEGRLREEIYEKVGETGSPTYDQIREMKYMRAFLNGMYPYLYIDRKFVIEDVLCVEVLRLYPPVLVFLFHKTMLMLRLMSVTVRLISGTYLRPS